MASDGAAAKDSRMQTCFQSLRGLALLAAVCLAFPAQAGEVVEIFNGKDLTGWVQKGGTAKYRVENGEIVGTSVPNTPNSFLCTERSFGDFVLELEVLQNSDMNSGIQFRSHAFDAEKVYDQDGKKIKVPAGRVHGYQFELDPTPRKWTGGIYDEGRRGWLYPLTNKPEAQAAYRLGQWNKVKIECVGSKLRTWVNGVLCGDLDDKWNSEGFIALQVHGVGTKEDPMEIRWRNLKLTKLDGAK